jgi:hypothetical protein
MSFLIGCVVVRGCVCGFGNMCKIISLLLYLYLNKVSTTASNKNITQNSSQAQNMAQGNK